MIKELKDLTIEQIGNFDCEHTECDECPFYPIRFDINYQDSGCIVNYLSWISERFGAYKINLTNEVPHQD